MSTVKRNLGWLLLSQAATWIVSILLLLVAPRMLGEQTFGQLSFVIVYMSFVELLATMGTSSFLVKTIARDTSSVGRYVANTLVMKLVMTIVLICAALALGAALNFERTTMQLVGAYSIGLLLNVVGVTIGAALTGLQLMAGPAKWNMLQCYVGGIGGLVILLNHGPLLAYAIWFNLSFIIPIPGNTRRLLPYMRGRYRIDVRLWKEILRGGFPFFVLAGLLVVYGTIDIPLLQAMTGSEQVGWYALAYRWVSVPAFFAAAVAGAFFPALSAAWAGPRATFNALANDALRLVVFVGTPAAIGIALIAERFLTLLYGGEFQQAVPLLRILALHIPIVSMDIILGTVVIAADRQRRWVMVSLVAAIFNPLLNLVAIPLTQNAFNNGAIGAAVVTVFTELILMAGAIALRPAGVLDWTTVSALLRILLASLVMIPALLALGSAPLAVLVLAGVITYGVASFALKTISMAEVRKWTNDILHRGERQPAISTPGVLLIEDVTAS